jgi:hypothetical protein
MEDEGVALQVAGQLGSPQEALREEETRSASDRLVRMCASRDRDDIGTTTDRDTEDGATLPAPSGPVEFDTVMMGPEKREECLLEPVRLEVRQPFRGSQAPDEIDQIHVLGTSLRLCRPCARA